MRLRRTALAILLFLALAISSCGPSALAIRTPTSPTATKTKIVPTKLPTLTETTSPRATVTALRSLNVRAEPGSDKPVIGALYAGEDIQLTGFCDQGWAQIVWDGGTAWVNADYLSDNKCKD